MAEVKVDLVEFRCWTQSCNHFVIDWCRHWIYIFQNLLDFLVQFSFCLLVFVGLIVEDVELRLAIILLLMHALDKKGFQNLLDFFYYTSAFACFCFCKVELRQALVLWLMQAMEKVDFSGRPRSRGSGEKRRNAHDWWHSLVARIIG